MTDKEKFLDTAWKYLACNGNYVCNTKLHLGWIDHWCAFAVSAIMQDCGFIGKYIKKVEGGAGSIPRESDGKYGTWFKKTQNMPPERGDLFFMRYKNYPDEDKYFCDHVGIVEEVNGNAITTLEGNVDGDYNGIWEQTSTFKRKTRYLSSWEVYAFYRPKWQTEQKSTSTAIKSTVPIYQLNSSKKVDYSVKVTATDGLNIRQGAGIGYTALGAVPYNAIVKVSRYTSGGKYKWGLVTYNGVMGWIALDYTQKCGKTVDELAREVIAGKWGNGDTRKIKLTLAGYDYNAVQRKVNQIVK